MMHSDEVIETPSVTLVPPPPPNPLVGKIVYVGKFNKLVGYIFLNAGNSVRVFT